MIPLLLFTMIPLPWNALKLPKSLLAQAAVWYFLHVLSCLYTCNYSATNNCDIYAKGTTRRRCYKGSSPQIGGTASNHQATSLPLEQRKQ